MCCSPKINIPPAPPPPAPVPPTEQELQIQRQTGELLGLNLEEIRQARAEQQATRGFLEAELGETWPQITARGAAAQARTAQAIAERFEKATRGELPVSPTLERSLTEGEATLREDLTRRFGPDYAASTPGREALENFRKRAIELREQSQRGEITRAEQLGFASLPPLSRTITPSPPQIGELYNMLFGERALKTRSGELGFQSQLNTQNLLSQAGFAKAQAQSQSLTGAMSLAGMLGAGAFIGLGI